MVSGIVGGRIAYVASDPALLPCGTFPHFRIDQGGLIYYGGFLGAAAAVVVLRAARTMPILALSDFVITSLPLGHAFGRVGCFLNGCAMEALSWGVRRP